MDKLPPWVFVTYKFFVSLVLDELIIYYNLQFNKIFIERLNVKNKLFSIESRIEMITYSNTTEWTIQNFKEIEESLSDLFWWGISPFYTL